MVGRKLIPINLKSTSPEGEVRFFKTICEATKELGFSERGMGRAYHTGRNQIGEYELEWLEPDEVPNAIPKKAPRTDTAKIKRKIEERMEKLGEENVDGKMVLNCSFCGKPLERKDRSNYISISRLDNKNSLGDLIDFRTYDSMYKASKDTGISLNALWKVREKGSKLVIRRKDKVPFEISWSNIHPNCFIARKEEARSREREEELEREIERKRMLDKMTEEELVKFKRREEEERNRKDMEFKKFFARAFCKNSEGCG